MFRKKITTISFEGSEIRTVVQRGKRIMAFQSRKVNPELMSQGLIHQPEKVGLLVADTIKELKGSRRNLTACITGLRSVHRIMRIPEIPNHLLEETIQRKARQEFAIPIEETDLSWRIISRSDNQILLYVLAVPSQTIDQLVAALRSGRIRPRVVDIKPLALQRAVGQGTALIVNLEEYSMGVTIVVNHIPVLIRTIPLDSGDLTGEAKVDLLSQELARTTKYYNESNKSNRLAEDTPVYLTGALFLSGGLETRLENEASLVERFQNRTNFPIRPPATNLQVPERFPLLRYAVNLGLALKNRS